MARMIHVGVPETESLGLGVDVAPLVGDVVLTVTGTSADRRAGEAAGLAAPHPDGAGLAVVGIF